MDILAYWRFDKYLRDLDTGAGFNFNSKQSRLHTEIHLGERLWLFTRIVNAEKSEYRLLARLNVASKTINAPGYQYGPYRIWGYTRLSRYFKATDDTKEEAHIGKSVKPSVRRSGKIARKTRRFP